MKFAELERLFVKKSQKRRFSGILLGTGWKFGAVHA
jgi:hypothetical protein